VSDPQFTAQFTPHAGTLRGAISGELDLATAPRLIAAFDAALNTAALDHAGGVVLDLTAVGFIDSSGLRALLQSRDICAARELPFALTVTDGPVTRLLDLAGVQDWFTYQPADPATNRPAQP